MKSFIKLLSLVTAASAVLILANSCKNTEPNQGKEPDSVNSEHETEICGTEGLYSYSIINNEATLTEYTGDETVIKIPDIIGNTAVTSLGNGLFKKNSHIKSVTIPNSVKKIEEKAFFECTSLESVTVPSSVEEIEASAFAETPWFDSLTDEFVIVGNGVALKYNGTLSDVIIPKGVKYVSNIFRYSDIDITSITLSKGVKCIGTRAFAALKSLTTVNFSSSLEKISDNAFSLCISLSEITIPKNVKEIGEYAFSRCKGLITVNIEAQLSTLGSSAFQSCSSLTSIKFPKTLAFLPPDTLTSCPLLETVTFEGTEIEISEYAFGYSPKFTVKCPKNSSIETYCIENDIKVITE